MWQEMLMSGRDAVRYGWHESGGTGTGCCNEVLSSPSFVNREGSKD